MLYLISTPIGNIDDITIRALQTLESCNYILCEDTRVAKKLISILHSRNLLKNADFTYISLHSHNEDSRIESLDFNFYQHNNIALISDAGTPSISDPGYKIIKNMQKNNIPYTIIPGCSAVINAFALSGFGDKNFKFIGFLPHKKLDKKSLFHKILSEDHIIICFESPKRILDSMQILSEISPNREIFLAKEITKTFERFYFGRAKEILEDLKIANLNGEWVIVINIDSNATKNPCLRIEDIISLSIPPKIKAKILSKITGKNTQDCYNEIIFKDQQ